MFLASLRSFFVVRQASSCLNEALNDVRYVDQNILIEGCFFYNYLSGSNGGVVGISSGSYCLDVRSSTFYQCNSKSGGAIYYISNKSNLDKICARKCHADDTYSPFAWIQASTHGFCQSISVLECAVSLTARYPLFLYYGDQTLLRSNFSMNKALYYSAFGTYHPNSFFCNYSTFKDNQVSIGCCLTLMANQGDLSFINVINNDSPNGFGLYSLYIS